MVLRLVTLEVKGNSPWVDVAIRETLDTQHAFLLWNIIMMGRESIWASLLGIKNKDCIITDILPSIHDLRTRLLYLNIFGTLKIIKWKIVRQSSTANSFNGGCNLWINEKISIINFRDHRLQLNERNELVFKCRHKGKSK